MKIRRPRREQRREEGADSAALDSILVGGAIFAERPELVAELKGLPIKFPTVEEIGLERAPGRAPAPLLKPWMRRALEAQASRHGMDVEAFVGLCYLAGEAMARETPAMRKVHVAAATLALLSRPSRPEPATYLNGGLKAKGES